MARKKLGELLVEAGAITEQSLKMALSEQRRWGGTLGKTLVEMKLLSESELVGALSKQLGMQAVDIDAIDIHPTVLELVPADFAEQHSVIPFAQPMKFLDVAMAEPTNLGVVDELRIRTQLNVRPYLAGPKMIERALAKHYRRGFGGRVIQRRDIDVPLVETGDTLAPSQSGNHLAIDPTGRPRTPTQAGAGVGGRSRPDTAEIDAARRREGLRPTMKPTRPPPLEMQMTPSLQQGPAGPPGVSTRGNRDAEIDALQDRISKLEALLERDEEVLRKLLALLVEKGVATREEILERIR